MQKWEYKSLIRSRLWYDNSKTHYKTAAGWTSIHEDGDRLPDSVTLPEKAKQLGEQGWELVAVVPFSSVLGARDFTTGEVAISSDFAGFTTEEKWVFKRPKN